MQAAYIRDSTPRNLQEVETWLRPACAFATIGIELKDRPFDAFHREDFQLREVETWMRPARALNDAIGSVVL